MMDVPTGWWRDFFQGIVVDMWLEAAPEGVTRKEITFIRKMLQVAPPAKVLDVACGAGRHALALAAAGYQMTGVDFSPEFLKEARSRAAAQDLAIDWVENEARHFEADGQFDAAYCFGNSYGYDDDEGNAAFLKAVFRSLKPGGRFLLDYPSVLEARLPKFQERGWFQIGNLFFLEQDAYDHIRGRTVTEYTFIRDGEVVKQAGSHRNYTYEQICRMLADAGFTEVRTFGSITGDAFQFGCERLILVGRKAT